MENATGQLKKVSLQGGPPVSYRSTRPAASLFTTTVTSTGVV